MLLLDVAICLTMTAAVAAACICICRGMYRGMTIPARDWDADESLLVLDVGC